MFWAQAFGSRKGLKEALFQSKKERLWVCKPKTLSTVKASSLIISDEIAQSLSSPRRRRPSWAAVELHWCHLLVSFRFHGNFPFYMINLYNFFYLFCCANSDMDVSVQTCNFFSSVQILSSLRFLFQRKQFDDMCSSHLFLFL